MIILFYFLKKKVKISKKMCFDDRNNFLDCFKSQSDVWSFLP